MDSAVNISQLQKKYGEVHALRGIDLTIPRGEFFGLLGPNGAGKSTLIHCIVGLVKANSGEVHVFGNSVQRNPTLAKSFLGFSPQEANVERFFNLRRTLEFQGGFYGLKPKVAQQRAQEMLVQFGLTDKANEQFFRLSGGMQKRLLIARAMMNHPQLLILDEPTAGVDVAQRHELWKYLRNLNRDGTTIILTTHYIDEAEALCERVGIINHGQVLELGSPLELIERYCQSSICLEIDGDISESEFHKIPNVSIKGQQLRVITPTLGPTTEKLLQVITAKPNRRIMDIHVQRGNLEDVFLQVTGHSIANSNSSGVTNK